MLNLQNLKKRLGFFYPSARLESDEIDSYILGFDAVLLTMGANENDLLAAIDANWDSWRPTYK